jgi:hypothetical protein
MADEILTAEDIDSPGERYDAYQYLRLYGATGVSFRRSPYDKRVRAVYADPDWQYRPEVREEARRSRNFGHPLTPAATGKEGE